MRHVTANTLMLTRLRSGTARMVIGLIVTGKQSVIVLNKDGKSDIEPLLKSLSDERENWVGALRKKRNEEK